MLLPPISLSHADATQTLPPLPLATITPPFHSPFATGVISLLPPSPRHAQNILTALFPQFLPPPTLVHALMAAFPQKAAAWAPLLLLIITT